MMSPFLKSFVNKLKLALYDLVFKCWLTSTFEFFFINKSYSNVADLSGSALSSNCYCII